MVRLLFVLKRAGGVDRRQLVVFKGKDDSGSERY
jgi:hypothetical protein